jgi:hypothetical protein
MESLVLLLAISAIVLGIQYNSDKVESLMEQIVERILSFSVQHTSIRDLQNIIKQGIFISQVGLLVIELFGFLGFIQAINNNNYHFVVIILWIGIFNKISSEFINPEYKKYYLLFMTSLSLVTSIHFNSQISILSNSCKLISLLIVDSLLTKAKYILLKFGFCAIIDTEINEDSFQSAIIKMLNEIERRISQVNDNGIQLNQTIIVMSNQVVDKTNEILQQIEELRQDVNYRSRHFYKFKLAVIFIIRFLYLDPGHSIPMLVNFSLFLKLAEMVIESVTIVDLIMDNAFGVLKIKFSKLKRVCMNASSVAKLISLANRRWNKQKTQ